MARRNKFDPNSIDDAMNGMRKLNNWRKKFIYTILLIACLAVVVILIVIMLGTQADNILAKYESLSGAPTDSRKQFALHNVIITYDNVTGKMSIEIAQGANGSDAGLVGTSDSDPGTPDTQTASPSPGASPAPGPNPSPTPGGIVQPNPVTPTTELKDVLAKVCGEVGDEEGYLAVLSCISARVGGSTDASVLHDEMKKPSQFLGYRSGATYNSVNDGQRAAIDRFINGERSTSFTNFVGPAGKYDIYAKKGCDVFCTGPGNNYFSQYKNVRASNSNPDSSVYVKIYDRASNTEMNCTRNGYNIKVNS